MANQTKLTEHYWDHKATLDQDIEQRLQSIDQVQRTTPPAPFSKKGFTRMEP